MARRLKLTVAYDGTPFDGWQSQRPRNTIQDHLERALYRVGGDRVRVHGSGRTDAGVHALAQCAHVDLESRLTAPQWTKALNALLPPTIRAFRCAYVSKTFHARYSAKRKVYRYRIWPGPVLPPMEYRRAWHVTAALDFDLLRKAASQFVGTHDFAGFAAKQGKSSGPRQSSGSKENSTVRTIYSARVRKKTGAITIEFEGNGFLYKMVRLMVGASIECATGKLSVKEITEWLASGGRESARFTAPADGLFLVRVRY